MIRLTCSSCGSHFEAEDYQQGQQFACTSCGTSLTVPTNPAAAPGAIPVAAVASSESSGGGTRVCFINKGTETAAFRTTSSVKEIYEAIEEMLHRLGLRVDSDWRFHGNINHSLSFFCDIKANGVVEQKNGGREIVLDLSWSSSMPTPAILIAIFLFPLGLILTLVFNSQAQNDTRRNLDDKFYDLRRRLKQ